MCGGAQVAVSTSTTSPKSKDTTNKENAQAETLIFLDVDGVLNVGVQDPGRESANLVEANVAVALELTEAGLGAEHPIAEKIVATYLRDVDGEKYSDFIADNTAGFSELLVARLAGLVRACGEREAVKVVLSSSWRMPRHLKGARALEQSLARHLGEAFAFDARTSLAPESGRPEQRLRVIGDFLSSYHTSKPLRVVVLEDFFTNAIKGWNVEGRKVDSCRDAERYLLDRAWKASAGVSARVIHTYDEWLTSDDMRVCIGSGLTKAHLERARAFVTGEAGVPFERGPLARALGGQTLTQTRKLEALGGTKRLPGSLLQGPLTRMRSPLLCGGCPSRLTKPVRQSAATTRPTAAPLARFATVLA